MPLANVNKLNEQGYEGAKLISDKIKISQKNLYRFGKSELEKKLEAQINFEED